MTIHNKKNGRIIQSVDRSARALLLFFEDVQELGIKDFARLLGLPKPTIYSLVNTLAHHQMLEQNPETFKYRLGPAFFRLGIQYARQSDVLSTVSVWTERLCYKFSKSVTVCMLMAEKAVVVYKADPDPVVISYPDVGAVVPFHNTANGKILLAFADPGVREEILNDYAFVSPTEFTIKDKAEFIRELDQVRQEGISFNRQEEKTGLSAVGGPIYNHRKEVVASFSILGKTDYFETHQDRIHGEVKKTAQSISRQLGYPESIYV
ncbi:MAG: IclR family transcriptional regulator [Desulfobacter sp.]|nr:IclR family transcriptional regulator [Desulfobacter sp.]